MEHRLIPLSDAVKAKADVVVGGTTLIGYVGEMLPTVAAFLSCVYLLIRIVEALVNWGKKKS
jgi:hypothetical protein